MNQLAVPVGEQPIPTPRDPSFSVRALGVPSGVVVIDGVLEERAARHPIARIIPGLVALRAAAKTGDLTPRPSRDSGSTMNALMIK